MSFEDKKPVLSIAEVEIYRRRQLARVLLGFLSLPILVCFFTAMGVPAQRNTLFFVCGVLAVVALLFSSMKIEVSDRFLRWSFGPGILRKRVALSRIESVERTRTSWFEGWGIHYTRRGWLYNVSGFEALHVTMKDGKRFLLGTNDAEALIKALSEGMARYS